MPYWNRTLTDTSRRSLASLMKRFGCDAVVVDSEFRRVQIELETIGEFWVGVPWTLDYPSRGFWVLVLSWDTFGENGLN